MPEWLITLAGVAVLDGVVLGSELQSKLASGNLLHAEPRLPSEGPCNRELIGAS
jgi:hypothetical protein